MNDNTKKILNIVFNAVVYVFLVIAVIAVILTLSSKRDADGAAEIFGYQMRVVTSDSMAECEYTDVSNYDIGSIPVGSLVFVDLVPDSSSEADEWYRSLKVGDVLTFRYVYTAQVTITHRITSIEEKASGGFIIELAGDNKTSESDQLYQTIDTSVPNSPNYVIGKVTGQSILLGWIISLLMAPLGIISIVILPCFIIIALEVVKIVRMYNGDRRKREREELEKKENELNDLRKKLAEIMETSGSDDKEESAAAEEEK